MEREAAARGSLRAGGSWGEVQTPEDVETMRRLRGLGWGTRRIAAELGCSRNTVKRWLALEGWQPYGRPQRQRALDGFEAWLEERWERRAASSTEGGIQGSARSAAPGARTRLRRRGRSAPQPPIDAALAPPAGPLVEVDPRATTIGRANPGLAASRGPVARQRRRSPTDRGARPLAIDRRETPRFDLPVDSVTSPGPHPQSHGRQGGIFAREQLVTPSRVGAGACRGPDSSHVR